MSEEAFALVPRSPSGVEKVQPGAQRILSGMVADALALATKEQCIATEAKFRIGEYEWCEPDYRQILTWAKALAIEPREVIERLQRGKKPDYRSWAETIFSGGRIAKLNWDFTLLPLDSFEWVAGLEITHLCFSALNIWARASTCELKFSVKTLSLPLSRLSHLHCADLGLTHLDFESPDLKELSCSRNQLAELDLNNVAKLSSLICHTNQIAALDLSNATELIRLQCSGNQIAHLNLSEATKMKILECGQNPLHKLDLSSVPHLVELYCAGSQLVKLDVSNLSELVSLDCWDNQLTELDVSKTHKLQKLFCYSNPIEILDIRPLHHLRLVQHDSNATRLLRRAGQNPAQHL